MPPGLACWLSRQRWWTGQHHRAMIAPGMFHSCAGHRAAVTSAAGSKLGLILSFRACDRAACSQAACSLRHRLRIITSDAVTRQRAEGGLWNHLARRVVLTPARSGIFRPSFVSSFLVIILPRTEARRERQTGRVLEMEDCPSGRPGGGIGLPKRTLSLAFRGQRAGRSRAIPATPCLNSP